MRTGCSALKVIATIGRCHHKKREAPAYIKSFPFLPTRRTFAGFSHLVFVAGGYFVGQVSMVCCYGV